VAVRQDFSGPFSGRALLIFPEANSLELVRVVVGRALTLEDIVDLEDEALAETGNIILNSWVATLANLLKRGLKMSLPVAVRGDGRHIFETAGQQQSNLVLFLHIRFEISKKDYEGEGFLSRIAKKLKLQESRVVILSRCSLAACRPLRFLGRSAAPIVDRRAKGDTYGVGTYPGLRHGDRGPGATAAE